MVSGEAYIVIKKMQKNENKRDKNRLLMTMPVETLVEMGMVSIMTVPNLLHARKKYQ